MAIHDAPGKTFLLHNPCGLRIEFTLHECGHLHLWYSPRADSSPAHQDRNFSNRDDHMSVWDAISFPDLTEANFLDCDYDPFHLTLRFRHQGLRIGVAFESPVVFVDSETALTVDFKSHRTDTLRTRSGTSFSVNHAERGNAFVFTARLRHGSFRHQPDVVEGRSNHARAVLAGRDDLLCIGGDLEEKAMPLDSAISTILASGWSASREADERRIAAALQPGSFTLRGDARLQKLIETNRRVLLAMQDRQGAIRAAINRIYYLIWVRDGAIIEAFNAQSGSTRPLTLWKNFLLSNPTRVENPPGLMFGQMVNPISKWQEDALFYVVWTVFQHWTQTGTLPEPDEIDLLEEVTDWFERYCFDPETGLFGRYFACETPFKGSRDYGIDGAVGKAVDPEGVRYEGREVVRSFDIYINILNWNVYRMLAEMSPDPARAARWADKADALRDALLPLVDKEEPDYGIIEFEDGKHATAPNFGLDRTDYEWALSITPFFPTEGFISNRLALFEKTVAKPEGCFLAGYFSIMQSIDPLDLPESRMVQAIRYATRQCHRPGAFLAMPDTVVEMLDVEDGDRYHDVRPQAFSIAPMLATFTGLGLRRLPHGLALRPTSILQSVGPYEYLGKTLFVRFDPAETRFLINEQPVDHSWQIPHDRLDRDHNELVFPGNPDFKPATICLVASTTELMEVEPLRDGVRYHLRAFGWNRIRMATDASFTLKEASGANCPVQVSDAPEDRWLIFGGTGRFELTVSR
jgi:hypothetical protein